MATPFHSFIHYSFIYSSISIGRFIKSIDSLKLKAVELEKSSQEMKSIPMPTKLGSEMTKVNQ